MTCEEGTETGLKLKKPDTGFVSRPLFNMWSCIGGTLAEFCGGFKDQVCGLQSQERTLKDQDDNGKKPENQDGVQECGLKDHEESILKGDISTRVENNQEDTNEIGGIETQDQEGYPEELDGLSDDDPSNEGRDFLRKLRVRGDRLQSEMLELLAENLMVMREMKKMQRDLQEWRNLTGLEDDFATSLDLGQIRMEIANLGEWFCEASGDREKLKEIWESKLSGLDKKMVALEEAQNDIYRDKAEAEKDVQMSAIDAYASRVTKQLEEDLERERIFEKYIEEATVKIEILENLVVELEDAKDKDRPQSGIV